MYLTGFVDIVYALKEIARAIESLARANNRIANKLPAPDQEVTGDE